MKAPVLTKLKSCVPIVLTVFLAGCSTIQSIKTGMDWDSHSREWTLWYGGGTQWREAGFTFADAKSWYDTGVTAPSEAFAWEGIGFSPDRARAWSRTGCRIADAKTFADMGISASEVAKWGLNCNVQAILTWRKAGVDPSEAAGWIEAKLSPESALAWQSLGFSPREAGACTNHGYASGDVKAMLDSQVALPEVKRVCEVLPKEVKAQWDTKFSLKDTFLWSNAFTFDQAVLWKKAGFTVDEARGLKAYGVEGAVKVKRACPKGSKNIYALLTSNPYDIDGNCFEFSGDTMQLLSRTTALFTQSQQVFYVDFEKDSVPNIGFQGIVKGMGVYEYTTRLGVSKKIPNLKKVWVLN